ncbi:MAG: ABC transporter substrate-binding protein [Aristaeellaceae bacterium]
MHKLLCLFLAAVMLVCIPAAFAEENRELKSIVVAEPLHLIGYLPLYVAIHEGYFAEEGLDVSVVQATGGTHVTAVVSGDAFAVIGGVDSYNFANQQSGSGKGNADPILAIVNCVNRANVYLFARTGLAPASDSPEDMADFLRGKIIIAGRYGGSPNVLTRYLVKTVGLEPDADVTLLENADATTVTALLQYGQGDIGNGGEPQISEGVTAGIFEEPFVKFPDLGDYAYSVIGVKKSTIENQPETCAAFVRAMLRALETVQTDRAIAEKVLLLEFPTLTDEGRKAALDRAYEDHLWSEDGYISQQAVDKCMEVVTVSGLFEGTWEYEKMVDLRFLPDAETAE